MKTTCIDRAALAAAVLTIAPLVTAQSCVPELIGIADSPNRDYAVDVSDGSAYVCDVDRIGPVEHGLIVFDIVDPAAPQLVGAVQIPDDPFDVAVQGSIAYVAAVQAGLVIVDVSNPASPQILGAEIGPGSTVAKGVDAADGYAYIVGGRSGGLWICDVSDPTEPTQMGFVSIPQDAFRVRVEGGLAYVAGMGNGLVIVDVSDPAAPTILGVLDYNFCGCPVSDVQVIGDLAYLAVGDWGLRIADVSDPTAPAEIGGYRFDDYPYHGQAYGLAVDGDLAVVGAQRALHILDVSDPTTPVEIGMYVLDTGSGYRPVLLDGIACLPVRGEGPKMIDYSSCIGTAPCNPADFAEPFGVLDMDDVWAFVDAFVAHDMSADLDGNGLRDLGDVIMFIDAFIAGCPA